MSIDQALNTGVFGLQSQSQALKATSNNIANVETTGYKSEGTSFESLVISGEGQGVQTNYEKEIGSQGALQQTGNTTDFAIDGEGFMVVGDEPGDNQTGLTNAGSFTPDSQGFLRNEQGKYLKGVNLKDVPVGADEPQLTPDNLEAVNIKGINYKPQPTGDGDPATTDLNFKGNLPRGAAVGDEFETRVSYVNDAGGNDQMTLRWEKTAANEYTLNVEDNAGNNVGSATLSFNDGTGGNPTGSFEEITGMTNNTGTVTSPNPGRVEIDIDGPGGNGRPMTLNLGSPTANGGSGLDGVTSVDGGYTETEITAGGSAFSTIERVQLNDDGVLQGIFKNGETQDLYRIPVGTVTSPDGLENVGQQTFRPGLDSGQLQLRNSGDGAGELTGGAIETSTVKLSEELTDLVTEQRYYSANATAVRTSDSMLQQTTQLKR